jgi:hypothetical protein
MAMSADGRLGAVWGGGGSHLNVSSFFTVILICGDLSVARAGT